ncbi:MAG TPA: hypothetical protein VK845_06495 [Gemmatimonadales bacterium]|nr:hypothetical protein [Gemmatimonadales bacterium]
MLRAGMHGHQSVAEDVKLLEDLVCSLFFQLAWHVWVPPPAAEVGEVGARRLERLAVRVPRQPLGATEGLPGAREGLQANLLGSEGRLQLSTPLSPLCAVVVRFSRGRQLDAREDGIDVNVCEAHAVEELGDLFLDDVGAVG